MGLFNWPGRAGAPALDATRPADAAVRLGTDTIARRVDAGALVPPACVGLVFEQGGHLRRLDAGARIVLRDADTACCFHPGPYQFDVTPYAQAPEIGLRLQAVIDSADPRVMQQRFDLYLMSEAEGQLERAGLQQACEHALQLGLLQGNLALPPCTTEAEWDLFRAGLNRLLYTRFGITLEECLPVDLGESVDYARILSARAAHNAAAPCVSAMPAPPATQGQTSASVPSLVSATTPGLASVPASAPSSASASIPAPASASALAPASGLGQAQAPVSALPCAPAEDAFIKDARALRRLFLELPSVMCCLRLALLPPGPALFKLHRELLQRLDLVSLSVNSMPSLEWATPDQPLGAAEQQRRARDSAQAVGALDEAWALLARLNDAAPAQLDALFDDADRIVANIEQAVGARRLICSAQREPA